MAISLGIFDSSSENRVFSSLEQRLARPVTRAAEGDGDRAAIPKLRDNVTPRPSRVLQGDRIGQVVSIDQRTLFAQRSPNFGNQGISFVSIPRRRNPAGLSRGECGAHNAQRGACHLIAVGGAAGRK
jgi:hypothetical protein